MKLKYHSEKLVNELQLCLIKGFSSRAITITAFIKAGFRSEPPKYHGISHFAEHMAFNGSKNFPSSKIEAEAVEKYGGWHMGYTWIEDQQHMVSIPKENFSIGLEVLLDSIYAPLNNASDIEKEKGVIREEILKNMSDPSYCIWNKVWLPLFFQNTSLGRPYYGEEKDIKRISKRVLDTFVQEKFRPENTILLVAGDCDMGKLKSLVLKKIENLKIKKNKISRSDNNRLIIKHNKKILVYNDSSYYKTSIVVGIPSVPFSHKDRHALNIIRDLLGGYFGSKIVQILKDEGGLIYDWNTYHDNLTDSGYLVFSTSTAHENVYKVIKIILKEFERISEGEISRKEIEVAKGHLIGSIATNVEKGQDYVEWYGIQELLNPKNVLSIEEVINIYKKISTEDIRSIGVKYFSKEKVLVGVLGRADKFKIERLLK
ncbi:MAG: insulinase family protein [Patescibacteria group bacterium]|nr:insulinase family protein [Actinomycetota bacterium]MCL5439082.1 insulinase family protein [Patescibacteria group bacterium]